MESPKLPLQTVKALIIGRPRLSDTKRIWDNYKVIGSVQKSDGIKLVIAAAIRDGVKYINIREFYFQKKHGAWRPAKDGITIPLKIPIKMGEEIIFPFPEFKRLVDMTVEELQDMPLSDPDNAIVYSKKIPYRLQYTDLDGKKFNMEVIDDED